MCFEWRAEDLGSRGNGLCSRVQALGFRPRGVESRIAVWGVLVSKFRVKDLKYQISVLELMGSGSSLRSQGILGR